MSFSLSLTVDLVEGLLDLLAPITVYVHSQRQSLRMRGETSPTQQNKNDFQETKTWQQTWKGTHAANTSKSCLHLLEENGSQNKKNGG